MCLGVCVLDVVREWTGGGKNMYSWNSLKLYIIDILLHQYMLAGMHTCKHTSIYVFDVHVTVHRNKFLIIKPTRCANFSNLFWNETLRVSDSSSVHQFFFYCTHSKGICHTGLLTACNLSTNLCDVYHCCVYSEKLLMMDRGTVLNM
jgi:hypothetical protein